MKRISIILADDHTIVREGFRKMFELEHDLEVVGEAQNGNQAVALVKKLRPAVVLMDISMPLLNGLLATRQVLEAAPNTKVIILSAHSDDAYVQRATDSGAMGFLLKQTSAADVCRAIREVQKGNKFYSPAVARRLYRLDDIASDIAGIPRSRNARLTAREMEVVQLIAEGKANKQVATEMGISVKTVEHHRMNLTHKLDIHDTAGLTRYAISAGIIQCSVQMNITQQ
jgi:DNA-binding NarL/FixJ family response regulator